MTRLFLRLAFLAAVVPALADELTTTDGKTYAAYTIVSQDDKGISIWYKDGQATLPFTILPPDVQKQVGYKPKELWTTDYKAALADAAAAKKPILLDFTGSDWCGYCQLLDSEVFTTPEFRTFAQASFICVTVDFPHDTELPAKIAEQNAALKQQFQTHGFPTLIVVDATGKELGRTVGYNPGSGSKEVIDRLNSFLGKGLATGN